MSLVDRIERLKQFTESEQEKALLSIIEKNKTVLVDLNTEQLFSGKDNQGQFLRPYRSTQYAAFKQTLNPASVTDLKLTGAFYESFFASTDKFPVSVFASDEKTSELGGKYGSDIFNLSATSKGEFNEQCKPEVIDYYRREVFNL